MPGHHMMAGVAGDAHLGLMGGPMPVPHLMMGGGQRGKMGRGVTDPTAYAHKLFIGQIPFDVRAAPAVHLLGMLRCKQLRPDRCSPQRSTAAQFVLRCSWCAPALPLVCPHSPTPPTHQPAPSPSSCPPILQAAEQDLWALFAPVGDILELAILRSQGRSKGCAFLTYATRAQVRGRGDGLPGPRGFEWLAERASAEQVPRAARGRCLGAEEHPDLPSILALLTPQPLAQGSMSFAHLHTPPTQTRRSLPCPPPPPTRTLRRPWPPSTPSTAAPRGPTRSW